MTELQAVILGVVQGVTEFLPISSTAHLKIVPALLGWKDAAGEPLDPGAAFTAVTQWGTWLATVIYFRHDLARILLAWWRGLVSGRPFAEQDSRLAWMIAAGTVPIVAFGLLLRKWIKQEFRSNYVIAWALIGLAVLLVVAELVAAWRRKRFAAQATEPLKADTPVETSEAIQTSGNLAPVPPIVPAAAGNVTQQSDLNRHPPQPARSIAIPAEKDLEHVGWFEALFIGFAQAVALVPGASRSGVTITGALFAGLDRPTAARFSFLLSLPAIFGAGLYSLYKDWNELTASRSESVNLILATVVAGLVGYASIALLIRYLRTHNTAVFIIYRIALGVALLVMLSRGLIAP
jgi:undecaprenyl-diphosphatase